MRLTILIACCLLLSAAPVEAQLTPEPIATLPKSIATTDGKATIYVDWASEQNGSVRVYVINRTGSMIALPTLHDRIYLYNEAQSKDGDWERSERWVFEMCGAGMGQAKLQPRTWIAQLESIGTPIRGVEKRAVRIRSYEHDLDTFSNAGVGYVYPQDIEIAKNDNLAIATASISRLKDILYSRDSTNEKFQAGVAGPYTDPRHQALQALTSDRHPRRDALAILEPIVNGSIPDLQKAASIAAERLQTESGLVKPDGGE